MGVAVVRLQRLSHLLARPTQVPSLYSEPTQFEDEDERTYHRLVAEFLEEAVDDGGKCLDCDTRTSKLLWIATHACLPIATCHLHCRNTCLWIASVLAVVFRAVCNFNHHLGGMLARLNVYICHNAAVDQVDQVHE